MPCPICKNGLPPDVPCLICQFQARSDDSSDYDSEDELPSVMEHVPQILKPGIVLLIIFTA